LSGHGRCYQKGPGRHQQAMMQKHSIYGVKLKASLHRDSGYGGQADNREQT